MAASPFSLENKIAIVTGGGVGIGRSVAIEFARAGADVVVASRKLENLEPVTAEIAEARPPVVRHGRRRAPGGRGEGAGRAHRPRPGRLDIMVNNAGASFRANPEDITANGWNTVVGINLNGVFFGCKWAGRQMMAQGGGVIINIVVDRRGRRLGDDAALRRLQGRGGQLHPLARHGLGAEERARELHRAGAHRDRGLHGRLTKQDPAVAKKAYDTVASRVGMGRWGKVEEIAYPCIFLASDASSFMTGETIIVDGGPRPAARRRVMQLEGGLGPPADASPKPGSAGRPCCSRPWCSRGVSPGR